MLTKTTFYRETFDVSLKVGERGGVSFVGGTKEAPEPMLIKTDSSTVLELKGITATLLPNRVSNFLKEGLNEDVVRDAHVRALAAWSTMQADFDSVPFTALMGMAHGIWACNSEGAAGDDVLAGRITQIGGNLAPLTDEELSLGKSLLEKAKEVGFDDETAALHLKTSGLLFVPRDVEVAFWLKSAEKELGHDEKVVCCFNLKVQAFGWKISALEHLASAEDGKNVALTPVAEETLDSLATKVRKQRLANDFGVGLLGQAVAYDRTHLTHELGVPRQQVNEEINRRLSDMPCWAVKVGVDLQGETLWLASSTSHGPSEVLSAARRNEHRLIWWNEDIAKKKASEVGGQVVRL